ncbi:MAG: hypothetical protein AAFN74_07935 [Myxococcota bacterium]
MGAQPDPPQRSWAARVRRRIGRELVLPFVRLTELGHRFGRFLLRTEYRVGGGCDKRGACCHHILMEWSPWLDRFPWLGRIVLWKLTRFYSFYDKGYTWEVQDGLLVRVLGCHALLPDGRCGEYRLRPLFCRTYPEVPLTGRPMVLSGCGYRFERRDGQPDSGEPALVHIGALARARVSHRVTTASAKTAEPDPQNSDSPAD